MKLEQQPNIEVHKKEYEEVKKKLREVFVAKDDPKEIEKLYSEVRFSFLFIGLDPEIIIEKIKKAFDSENAEEFVDLVFGVLKKIIDYRIEHPEVVEKVRRERVIQESGSVRLSELMYYNLDLENGAAIIHIAPGHQLKLSEIIKAFRDGLKELAKQTQQDERIKEIQATSWIVASNPGILKMAGFTVEGVIDEKMKAEHFSDEQRPVWWAHMSREELLKKYL
jgi:hypothetical protein